MLENNRHLFAFCVVCGAIGSYLISIYVLILVFVVCVFIFVLDYKLLGESATTIKEHNFPVPSWVKSVITSLMNSYHLSKPLEHEPIPRRSSPFSPSIPLPRRPSCRSGRYSCLDENTDYTNRKNGFGLCNTSPGFNNSYPTTLHSFRRRSGFSDTDSSSKIEEFSTQTSPWVRRHNYSVNEFGNVRRVQTVAGPLLATSSLTKRKSNDFGLYVDANSPGLASRIVQYREEGMSTSSSVWTHQPQYNSPGQFPMVHLSHSPSSLPVLSPLSSQKASRRSVRVKIAPPDPLGSRLYPLSTKNSTTYSTIQAEHSTKSVLDTLKEISRKRIHSQLEDSDDDAVKRQKRSEPADMLSVLTNGDDGDGENMAKRLREESPHQYEMSPPTRPAKRICNNEILSSLSSSRKLLQGGGVKRKTQNLDWSRCSTPVLGKQQKTVGEDATLFSSPKQQQSAQISSTSSQSSQRGREDDMQRSSQKSMNTPSENERIVNNISSDNHIDSDKNISRSKLQSTTVPSKVLGRELSAPVDNTPWQKDSPFVRVSSPDDVIDDVSAFEEKREEDRRSRLLSMMTVISGGEPPVKVPATTADTAETGKNIFKLDGSNNSFVISATTNNFELSTSRTKPLLGSSLSASASDNAGSTGATSMPDSTQSIKLTVDQPTAVSNFGPISDNPVSSSSMLNFGNASTSLGHSSPAVINSADKQAIATLPVTSSNTQLQPAVFTSSSPETAQSISSPPVFGSTQSVFGSKTAVSAGDTSFFNSLAQQGASTTAGTTLGNLSFGFTPVSNSQISFGVQTTSVTPPVSTVPATASVVPAGSTTVQSSSSMFSLPPSTGFGNDNSVSSSSGGFSSSATTVVAAPSSGQMNAFSKTITFGAPEKQLEAVSSGVGLFGGNVNPSVPTTATSSFAFGNATSGSQIKSGLFTLGSTSVGNSSSLPASNTTNMTSAFSSSSGAHGQPVETSIPNVSASNQTGNTLPATSKVGGFKFHLTSGKSPSITQPSLAPNATTNVFENPSSATVSSDPKQFSFGSTKPADNPFALNSSKPSVSQNQTSVNLFESSAVQSKPSDIVKSKENPFAFGSNTAASPVFSTPQTGGFTPQPAAVATTKVSSGFSFSSAAPSGFSQPQSVAGGFGMQAAATSAVTFANPSTSTTAANSAFTFGSPPSNQALQSNLFSFGVNTSTSESQPGNPFAFGSGGGGGVSAPASGGSGLFGQSIAPASTVQPQVMQAPLVAQAPAPGAPAFQFGAASSTPQLSGSLNFGSPSATNPASAGGFSSGGSFQMSSGGFGSGPAMFSIGSGSTAPRARSRVRRTNK